MKIWKIITALLLCLTLLGVTACNALGGDEETSEQPVEVVRGDLLISVSGNGNIETSREAMLSFGSGGRIDKISVEEGDEVTEGDIMASLDTRTLELAKTQAEVALTQAQIALTQAQVAQQTAEFALENTRDKEEALELALFQAQINVRTAEHALDETRDIYTWPEIKVAQEEVDEWKAFLDYLALTGAPPESLGYGRARLEAAENKLDAMIQSYDTEEVAIAKLQVEAAEMAEAQAQNNLDKVAKEVALAEIQVEAAKEPVQLAIQSVDLAQQSLDETQKQLDEATIMAPFSGVIAGVYAKEDDLITAPTMAPQIIIHLIDPKQMELNVEVDEIDIPQVKLNQETIVTLDALPDDEFNGKVATIFPIPVFVGGVVLYNVNINLNVPENSELKVGMSATADIVITKRNNVLLVPDRAIGEDDQGNPVVRVVVDEEVEERRVVIGVSDGFSTEIISGLSEGEIVVETRVKRETSGGGLF